MGLSKGDVIWCSDKEEMVDMMQSLAKEGIETDFCYKYGLEVIKVTDKEIKEEIVKVRDLKRNALRVTALFNKKYKPYCEVFKLKNGKATFHLDCIEIPNVLAEVDVEDIESAVDDLFEKFMAAARERMVL